jgi:hypothetical protein
MRIVRSAALAACVVVTSSAIAAPFPASSENPFQSPTASTPIDAYQAFSDNESCPLTNICSVRFGAVSGSRVLIVHTTCSFILKTGDLVLLAGLTIGGKKPSNPFPVTKMGDASGGTYYVINAQTYLFVGKGDIPEVTVGSSGAPVSELECTVSGYHA